ncbi:carboxypeptidase D [Malassezia psittaci]|uniref:Carboxypeptidase n=1 Tax=Malassezia psittaci TaxID=1821823 RepID=A0AAF0FAI8_9BASI|nr:carboxypeptidase D [Malassezia psittaci]
MPPRFRLNVPGIPFKLPHSWAGNLPISAKKNESDELFFWLWEPANDVGHDDVVVWLNGGPGCSSLEGLFQENGPFSLPMQKEWVVKQNPYSWTNLSHVVWVENPVGVGFTKGTPDIKGERDLAREFYGFLEQFYETFAELKGKRLWITGESYAGMYIPYIAHEIYQHPTNASGINLQGISINDPSFTTDFLGEEAPAFEYFEKYYSVMGLNQSSVESVRSKAKKLGVETYVADNLHYPSQGPITVPSQFNLSEDSIWEPIYDIASKNPCFSIYEIKPNCDFQYDPLGAPLNSQDSSKTNFINDTPGLKKAIHAETSKAWVECTETNVFKAAKGQTDPSTAPDRSVLPNVIEKNQKTVIQHGTYDYVLIANGSALAIQNMTWNGKMGFEKKPSTPIKFDGKTHGVMGEERGLTFALVDGSGHMIPQFKPKTAYKLQQYLLGQVSKGDFDQ